MVGYDFSKIFNKDQVQCVFSTNGTRNSHVFEV